MIIDAATLIRAASGVVFVGVGLILAWVTRRSADRVANLGMATCCAGFGAGLIVINATLLDPDRVALGGLVQGAGLLVAAVGAGVYLASPCVRAYLRPWDALVGLPVLLAISGLLVPGTGALFFSSQVSLPHFEGADAAIRAELVVNTFFFGALALVSMTSARAARQALPDGRTARGHALLTLGLMFFPAYLGGFLLTAAARSEGLTAVAVGYVGIVATAALPWLQRGRATAWGLLGIVLVGEVVPFAFVGLLRIAAGAVVAVAMLQYGLAGAGLQLGSARRGSLAAGALAALFIVAQVAQEFLAAEYGLLMGGAVAGTLLFAAHPIQRAMERLAGHEGGPARGSDTPRLAVPTGSAREREQSYREAVRTAVALARRGADASADASSVALRDRVLSREEERHLLRLAYHLGVSTPRAIEIHDEVERERDREEVAP